MSIESYCCLCYTASFDFQLIQNEEGESTEAYDITVKYFDPMVCMPVYNPISHFFTTKFYFFRF